MVADDCAAAGQRQHAADAQAVDGQRLRLIVREQHGQRLTRSHSSKSGDLWIFGYSSSTEFE